MFIKVKAVIRTFDQSLPLESCYEYFDVLINIKDVKKVIKLNKNEISIEFKDNSEISIVNMTLHEMMELLNLCS